MIPYIYMINLHKDNIFSYSGLKVIDSNSYYLLTVLIIKSFNNVALDTSLHVNIKPLYNY